MSSSFDTIWLAVDAGYLQFNLRCRLLCVLLLRVFAPFRVLSAAAAVTVASRLQVEFQRRTMQIQVTTMTCVNIRCG